jgi:hypothetical protein
MRSLLVAAGGGGDVVGAILARDCIAAGSADPLLIATYAWERVRIDPEPGPRPPRKFSNLGAVGGSNIEVLAGSDTVPLGRSTLPRVVADTGARLFVLDADHGAMGMRDEIRLLIDELAIESVVLLDVGGDAVARGSEPELLSPLADSLALAACVSLAVPVLVAIVGPGVDGELTESTVLGYLEELGATRAGVITREAAESLSKVLRWHPTEATALVAAAALGVRGSVELRRDSISAALTDHSAEVWLSDIAAVSRHNSLVPSLVGTTSLYEAEEAIARWATSELIRERRRALEYRQRLRARDINTERLIADVVDYSREAAGRGIELITTRRLAEAIGHPELEMWQLTDMLLSVNSASQRGPIWYVPGLARTEYRPNGITP